MRKQCRALMVGLDGVLRFFSIEKLAAVEETYGLRAGVLPEVAFHHSLLYPLVEGEITHAQWMELTAEAVADLAWPKPADGPDDRLARARAAMAAWQADRGEVDAELVAFIREVRASGIPVVLCANASDVLDADLAALELIGEFDLVANSSAMKLRKPDKEYFAQAALMIGIPKDECLLIDDSDRTVSGARVAGMAAYRFTGHDDLKYVRAALGLAPVS